MIPKIVLLMIIATICNFALAISYDRSDPDTYSMKSKKYEYHQHKIRMAQEYKLEKFQRKTAECIKKRDSKCLKGHLRMAFFLLANHPNSKNK